MDQSIKEFLTSLMLARATRNNYGGYDSGRREMFTIDSMAAIDYHVDRDDGEAAGNAAEEGTNDSGVPRLLTWHRLRLLGLLGQIKLIKEEQMQENERKAPAPGVPAEKKVNAKAGNVVVTENTTANELMELLTKKLEETYSVQNSIRREGNQITIPQHMGYKEAAEALVAWNDSMEEEINRYMEFEGHPDDLLLAFYNSLRRSFGNVMGGSQMVNSFFGQFKIPGQTKSIKTGPNSSVAVPIGRIAIPGLPIKIDIKFGDDDENDDDDNIMKSKLQIRFTMKAKYGALADMIERAMAEELRDNPLFKGKAVDSRWNFLDTDSFRTEKIVYSAEEDAQLNAHLFRIIRSTDVARKKGVNIKRTVLLHGQYGTGKTLTALKAAKICTEHGWTFMNVVPGDGIAEAFEFAKKFQPCMVFFEDIDRAANQDDDRDEGVNTILNTIDGILSKNAEVVTILTTNHTDKIEKAMLRPGRIDAVIEMGRLDSSAVGKLVAIHLGSQMAEEVDADMLFRAAQGYTPAFVVEACSRAVLYAMERTDGNGNGGGITNEDVRNALVGLRGQYDLMIGADPKKPSEETIDELVKKVAREAINEDGPAGEAAERIDIIARRLRAHCPHF